MATDLNEVLARKRAELADIERQIDERKAARRGTVRLEGRALKVASDVIALRESIGAAPGLNGVC